jgi:hypothetical protein
MIAQDVLQRASCCDALVDEYKRTDLKAQVQGRCSGDLQEPAVFAHAMVEWAQRREVRRVVAAAMRPVDDVVHLDLA